MRVAAAIVRSMPLLYAPLAFLTARRIVVRGRSMTPTLLPGERVLFDRLAYQEGRPEVGDIVLARHPARLGLLMIKRIAAVPGDCVPRRDDPAGRLAAFGHDEYILLGDNPESSTDSRELGPFRRKGIVARGWLIYWPPERFRRL